MKTRFQAMIVIAIVAIITIAMVGCSGGNRGNGSNLTLVPLTPNPVSITPTPAPTLDPDPAPTPTPTPTPAPVVTPPPAIPNNPNPINLDFRCDGPQPSIHVIFLYWQAQARCVLPGMERFWEERHRVEGQESPLRINDAGFHGQTVSFVAGGISFVKPQRFFDNEDNRGDFFDDVPIGRGVINHSARVAFFGAFPNSRRLPLSRLQEVDSVLVNAAGNCTNCLAYQPGQEVEFSRAVATGLVLFVVGIDYQELRQGRYFVDTDRSATCGGVVRVYCLAASFSVRSRDGNFENGTSFSTPLVSAALANTRMLWPDMTSQQTVQLAQYCARPINDDQTLSPWGTILDADSASEIWGQGVFSVECLYEPNGALTNPITGTSLSGAMTLLGTHSQLRLIDRFGRGYTFSQNKHDLPLFFLPETIGFFVTENGAFGYAWNKYLAFALREEQNNFFNSYGTGDFIFGDTWTAIMQLGYEWDLPHNIYFGLSAQSTYGKMNGVRASLVRAAEGHRHQLTAKISYRITRLQAYFTLTYASGVMAELDIESYGRFRLKPEPAAQARFKLSANF